MNSGMNSGMNDGTTGEPRYPVSIEPAGLRFEAPASLPLLKAAQAAGVHLPSSCRNGTCRACMCRLTSGHVEYSIEWPGLLAEEKREGWILPCVALPRSPLTIEAPAAQAACSSSA